ncbi:MAG: hypothetical protein U5O39_11205 [Gammaproteobacteria bacterium]|nr:hypothetical protein [Gammaproteobacteria bacterium]
MLAAVAAPPEQIDEVARLVNACEGVNHNYAREHHFNLWFVVTAANQRSSRRTTGRDRGTSRIAVTASAYGTRLSH